ncbi:GTP-binding protein [Brachybacterium hainanense]|uniref:GTP-binding protein n=1 Tax=Brachybacterium hainanense TaxID=1541174 RepID=A0ABV6R5V4_9MICO
MASDHRASRPGDPHGRQFLQAPHAQHRTAAHRARRSTPVALVTAIDPILREALLGSMLLDAPSTAILRYEVEPRTAALRRLVVDMGGVLEDALVELEHPCVSCAMREDAVAVLHRLAADPRTDAVLLAPPISADPLVVAGTLVPHQGRWHLSGAVCVLEAERAIDDLLGDATLAERGLQWASEDERSIGEALAAQIEYSDLVVLDGAAEHPAEAELVEHLRAPEQHLVPAVHRVGPGMLLRGALDHGGGMRRRDVRRVEAYGGPVEHGTWTLDLSSERPFHPQRFLEDIELLGAGRMRGRGRFWVPDRPGTICQWDGAGGQVSIGSAHEAGTELPTTRLVITGIDAEDLPRVRDAFARCLLTPQEWAQGLGPWLGAEDALAPWLGERDARV